MDPLNPFHISIGKLFERSKKPYSQCDIYFVLGVSYAEKRDFYLLSLKMPRKLKLHQRLPCLVSAGLVC